VIEWQDLLTGFSLFLVFEGLLPFVNPARYRGLLESILTVPDSALRNIGLGCMIAGVIILYLVR